MGKMQKNMHRERRVCCSNTCRAGRLMKHTS